MEKKTSRSRILVVEFSKTSLLTTLILKNVRFIIEQYGWFFNRENKTNRGIRKGGPAIGYEETVNLIEKTFENHGPFDGIMGFSQGACLVGLLCDLQQRGCKEIKLKSPR